MTLSFKHHIQNTPTHFMEKILHPHNTMIQKHFPDMLPKIHTIRKGNRWKAGMKMHMVYHNRSKNRFQFNENEPELQTCNGVQEVELNFHPHTGLEGLICSEKEDRILSPAQLQLLAANDGFNSTDELIYWFFPDGQEGQFFGQIIHFTDFKY